MLYAGPSSVHAVPSIITAADSGFVVSDEDIMERVAKATGGRCFAVSKSMPIDTVFAIIQEDLRSQYRVSYILPKSPDNSYHTKALTTRDEHLKVQARTGYVVADWPLTTPLRTQAYP